MYIIFDGMERKYVNVNIHMHVTYCCHVLSIHGLECHRGYHYYCTQITVQYILSIGGSRF